MSLPKNADPNKTNFANGLAREALDCCCALLTGPGRSAVAVVGVRGDDALASILRCFQGATQSRFVPGQVRYGRWVGCQDDRAAENAVSSAESVVVVPLAAGDFEVQCHGGVAASARIINDLRGLGAECVEGASWDGRDDVPLLIREAEQVLTSCLTAAMAAVAMDQIRGAMHGWCEKALAIIQESGKGQLNKIRDQAQTYLLSADLGLRLGRRYQVVLLGPPNVGKSSLVNAIVGYDRSITMDLAGTTRDVLHAETVIAGVPIRLSDTAGLSENAGPIEQQGVVRARGAAKDADLIVLVSNPGTPAMDVPTGKRTLSVLNKSDLGDISVQDDSVIRTVATTGLGVDVLIDAIAGSLVQLPPSGTPVPVTQRQVDLLGKICEAAEPEAAEMLLATLVDG